MSTQRLSGSFSQHAIQGLNAVIGEYLRSPATGPTWSPGALRATPIQIQPSLMEKWNLLGFSMRCQAATLSVGAAPWGYLGDLWAGLLVDSSVQDAQAASLPQDLSTFTKLFDGQDDTLPQMQSITDTAKGLLTSTFMFPSPLAAVSGTQLQMALVLTPTLINTIRDFWIVAQTASYTLIYDDGK